MTTGSADVKSVGAVLYIGGTNAILYMMRLSSDKYILIDARICRIMICIMVAEHAKLISHTKRDSLKSACTTRCREIEL